MAMSQGGKAYRSSNEVVEFEPDRRIAWRSTGTWRGYLAVIDARTPAVHFRPTVVYTGALFFCKTHVMPCLIDGLSVYSQIVS